MKLQDTIIGAVATWRLTHMLLFENGPFRAFRQGREALGNVYVDEDSEKLVSYKYEIVTCIWCLSMWVGAGIAAGLRLNPGVTRWLLLPYVFSAFAASWNKIAGKES